MTSTFCIPSIATAYRSRGKVVPRQKARSPLPNTCAALATDSGASLTHPRGDLGASPVNQRRVPLRDSFYRFQRLDDAFTRSCAYLVVRSLTQRVGKAWQPFVRPPFGLAFGDTRALQFPRVFAAEYSVLGVENKDHDRRRLAFQDQLANATVTTLRGELPRINRSRLRVSLGSIDAGRHRSQLTYSGCVQEKISFARVAIARCPLDVPVT